MFQKVITLNRVRDKLTVKEGNERIDLYVDQEANKIIHALKEAQKGLIQAGESADEEDRRNASLSFSEAIFGKEQTDKLLEFYHGDFNCVLAICGLYFGNPKKGLGKKITKAQKKL